MRNIIYNEGRVVGYSAYELYVRRFKEADPTGIPLDERSWLASSLSSGSSLLLRLPNTGWTPYDGQTKLWKDIELPENSQLTAASTIYASFFMGQGVYDDGKTFAKAVASVGGLIPNTSTSYPEGSTIPAPASEDYKANLSRYLTLIDGVVYQPGTWTNASVQTTEGSPSTIVTPNFSQKAVLRISRENADWSGEESYVEILLTGFLNSAVLIGETGISNSEGSHPENGDFLGPECFPWSSKVIFTVPTNAISSLLSDYTSQGITRIFPSDATDSEIDIWLAKGGSGIKMESNDGSKRGLTFIFKSQGTTVRQNFNAVDISSEYISGFEDASSSEKPTSIKIIKSGSEAKYALEIPNNNVPVPTSSKILTTEDTDDMIDWNTLLRALASSSFVDLLGEELRIAKLVNFTAWINYIQINPPGGTPVRLYFGSAGNVPNVPTSGSWAPPAGCIVLGIGW